ncbi:MAG: DUF1189 family protein [Candidatus Woesearchaeota archaeon]
MEFKPLFRTLAQSINPYAYHELREHKFAYAMKYFCFLLLLLLAIMFILFIPALFYAPQDIQSAASNFNTFTFKSDISFDTPFIFMEDPLVVFSKNATLGDATLLFTDNGVYYRSFIVFGKVQELPFDKETDIKNDAYATRTLSMFLFFLGPSLFFWAFVVFAIYFWIIIFITFLLGILLTRLLSIPLRLSRILKTAVYTSTILVVLQLILMPFYRLFYLPIIAYWILFIIVIVAIKDGEEKPGTSVAYDAPKHSSKSGIWDKPSSSSREDRHTRGDEYPTPSASKRKRSFDEENDGYVTLK